MIAAEATPADDPGKGAFDHPSSGQGLKPWWKEGVPFDLGPFGDEQTPRGNLATPHNGDGPAQMLFEPADELASVVAIAPQQLNGGKERTHALQHALGSLLVGVMGTADPDFQQIPLRVDQDVPFAAPDFFSPDRSLSRGHERHWF
jgi:hypothetical protein